MDRLSNLPEELQSYVLSLMPTVSAIRSSLPSSYWRYLWQLALARSIVIDDTLPFCEVDRVSQFLDHLIIARGASNLEVFRVHLMHVDLPSSTLSRWLHYAIQCNVKEIDLEVGFLSLPDSFGSCNTLRKLKLCLISLLDWDAESPVLLPNLLSLDVRFHSEPSSNFCRLIQGCPALKTLSLQVDWQDSDKVYNLDMPNLETLELINRTSLVINTVILNVPNLKHLTVGGTLSSYYKFLNMSSSAVVSISVSHSRFDCVFCKLLDAISGAESLVISESTHVPLYIPFPVFKNLRYLKFKGEQDAVQIFHILESCSKLEVLCIEKVGNSSLHQQDSVPICFTNSIKTIKFERVNGEQSSLDCVKYALDNAQLLRNLKITCCPNLTKQKLEGIRKMLLTHPKTSDSKIMFRACVHDSFQVL